MDEEAAAPRVVSVVFGLAEEALHSTGGYSGIVAAFMASVSTESIEQAIWASPWASGHYDNGGHWSYVPMPVVSAPTDAWG